MHTLGQGRVGVSNAHPGGGWGLVMHTLGEGRG